MRSDSRPSSRTTRSTGSRSARTFEAWADRTPDDFVMAVKVSRFLTHIKRLAEPDGAGRAVPRPRPRPRAQARSGAAPAAAAVPCRRRAARERRWTRFPPTSGSRSSSAIRAGSSTRCARSSRTTAPPCASPTVAGRGRRCGGRPTGRSSDSTRVARGRAELWPTRRSQRGRGDWRTVVRGRGRLSPTSTTTTGPCAPRDAARFARQCRRVGLRPDADALGPLDPMVRRAHLTHATRTNDLRRSVRSCVIADGPARRMLDDAQEANGDADQSRGLHRRGSRDRRRRADRTAPRSPRRRRRPAHRTITLAAAGRLRRAAGRRRHARRSTTSSSSSSDEAEGGPVHAQWHTIELDAGPYRVIGEMPTMPGFDPGRALARPTGEFVFLRDARIRLIDRDDAGEAERRAGCSSTATRSTGSRPT